RKRQRYPGGEHDIVELGTRSGERLLTAEVHGVGGGVDLRHPDGASERHAEALALSHGEAMHARVLADDASRGIDDGAGPNPICAALLDEARVRVLAATDEAELLALALGGTGQAARTGFGPHLGLGALAEREHEALELLPRRGVEKVALVLLV